EISECDWSSIRLDIRHVLGLRHRKAHQHRLASGSGWWLPDIVAVAVLLLAQLRLGLAIHHPVRVLAVSGLQRIDKLDQRVSRVLLRQPRRITSGKIADIPPAPAGVL